MISVVVPARGEGAPAPVLLARLAGAEVIVAADAATPEAALEPWRRAGARVLTGAGPRGARLAAAAREARGEVLLFLHADTLLPEEWRAAVGRALADGALSGAFRLAFDGGGAAMRLVAFWANLRTSITRVPYGDQAPFVRRDAYERAGGHPAWPLLDDYELSRRLKRQGRVALLREAALTSPRRYLAQGVARTVLTHWSILVRHRFGASATALAERYRGEVGRPRSATGGTPPRRGAAARSRIAPREDRFRYRCVMQTLFDPEDLRAILDRLARLQPGATRSWGKMDPAQMLAHCAVALEMATGDAPRQQKLIGKIFAPFVKKGVLGEKPFSRNSPTDPSFVVSDPRDFEVEKKRLTAIVEKFARQGSAEAARYTHSFFGKLTGEEWGVLGWKHLDHHLRQFGM